MSLKKQLFTVYVFVKLSTRRFFRDRLAIFFTVVFPLIFLFVFGGIFGKNSAPNFKVALINQSQSEFAKNYVKEAHEGRLLKVDDKLTTIELANEKMKRGELDAAIVLPPDFGAVKNGLPGGIAKIVYTANNEQAAQTLVSVLQAQFNSINTQLIKAPQPFTVVGEQSNQKSLSRFDYTFAGLLGFSILGLGIFGPINVFPELKKQGVLRRLHTTPLKVWQYFMANVFSQAIIGLITMAILFAVAMTVFHLKLGGNIVELALFLVFGITSILGIGLAIGGWARNERQAAPLANLIVFPMMFLSGTFFPRYVMPEWLQKISNYLPLTPVIDGIRLVSTEGKHLTQIGAQLGVMAVWTVVVYAIAFRSFRWE